MIIRKATKKDLDRVAQIVINEYGKAPWNEKWSKTDAIKTVSYFNKIGRILVPVEGKKIVGFIIYRIEYYEGGKKAMIEELAIDSDYRRKGIASKLIKAVEKECRKLKVNAIWLLTSTKAPAFKLYKKQKYKDMKNAVLMEKKLAR
ncbi:GNAT family N-acetyltransferase [Candidatus Woesearchaeota archaeon]|nr:GNAT family N-acetyltransferase [Candidatus Woesearchaeota archaeon]